MDWITVEETYLEYLRNNCDNRIPYTNYGNDHYKPFFGVLFYKGDYAYVTQVSSPKARHTNMKNNPCFIKVMDGNNLLCVVNLNYMFPVKNTDISYLKYSNIGNIIKFKSEIDKNKYVALLKKEMSIMKTLGIKDKAKKLYQLKINQPDYYYSKQCLDFVALESACDRYSK